MAATLDVPQLRLLNQQIGRPRFDEPSDVVANLGAVQAQDYSAALWAIGLRLGEATRAKVEDAVASGAIIRTWPMRGTLHFVAAADARWMLRLCAPRAMAGIAGRLRRLEIDDDVLARARKLVPSVLRGGRHLPRPELYRLLGDAGISTAGQRGVHIVVALALEGLICIGPREGNEHTLALLDEWAPVGRDFTREEALAELTVRYFRGHGPATAADFAWWSGLTLADVRLGLSLSKSHLVPESIEGRTYWLSADPQPLGPPKAAAYLLPAFDEYLVGYRARDAVLSPAHVREVNAGGGILRPSLVSDGQVVGTWKHVPASGAVLTIAPFASLSEPQRRDLRDAAARYARFLAITLTISKT
jgi:hypothetical protein